MSDYTREEEMKIDTCHACAEEGLRLVPTAELDQMKRDLEEARELLSKIRQHAGAMQCIEDDEIERLRAFLARTQPGEPQEEKK